MTQEWVAENAGWFFPVAALIFFTLVGLLWFGKK